MCIYVLIIWVKFLVEYEDANMRYKCICVLIMWVKFLVEYEDTNMRYKCVVS